MQPWVTDDELLAAIRNMLVGAPQRVGPMQPTDGFVVASLAASSAPIRPPISSARRGWWVFQCTDAFIRLTIADARTGPGQSLERVYRLGPASRLAVYLEAGASISFTVAAALSTETVDPVTGLVSTATAAPQLRGWWASSEAPPTDTRSGAMCYDDGSATLASRAGIGVGTEAKFFPPGYARRCQVIASSSIKLSAFDSVNNNVVGEIPAARTHDLAALDPWQALQLSVDAGTANAWLSWGDQ